MISTGAKTVAAGRFHSMVIKQDGSVWGAGSNLSGQLGDGSTINKDAFVRLTPFANGL